MKLSEFADILGQAGLPVTYRAYQEGNVPDMPYLVYFESNPIVNVADNTRNHEIKCFRAVLFRMVSKHDVNLNLVTIEF